MIAEVINASEKRGRTALSDRRAQKRKGFTFAELLAVALVLSVLAAVAVPLYLNTRQTSAARACKANVAALAAGEAAYALRNNSYATLTDLATAPEGLAGTPKCPLDNSSYSVVKTTTTTAIATGETGGIDIKCPNATTHKNTLYGTSSTQNDWVRTLAAISTEVLP